MITKMTVYLFGWLAGLAAVILFYHFASEVSSMLAVAAFFAAGFGIGVCACFVPWIALHPGAFARASLFGVLTAAVPVILATYGFALVLLPVVALWSGTIYVGLRSVQHMRDRGLPVT
jgi:hypothetical protein